MATINEVIASIETDMRRAKARRITALESQKKLLDSLRNAGKTSMTDAETMHLDNLRNEAGKAAEEVATLDEKLRRALKIKDEEDENDRLSEPNPSTRKDVPNGRRDEHMTNPAALMGYNAHDGAVLAPGQRFNDHPVAQRAIEDTANRDAQILGSYGTLGQQVRAITTGGANFSSVVPTVLSGDVIDLMRNQAQVMRAGARIVPMNAKTVEIGRLTSDPTAEFIGTENTAFNASDPVFDSVQLVAKTMDAVVVGSVEWFQDVENSDQLISSSLAKVMALKLDEMALYGGNDGSTYGTQGVDYSNAKYPVGILVNTATNASDNLLGNATNGTPLTAATPYAEFLDTIYALRVVNEEPNAAIMNPYLAKCYAQMVASDYQPVRAPEDVANLSKLLSNQSVLYGQGTGTNQSDLFVGDFSQLLIGVRADLRLRTLTERYAEQNSIAIVATMRMDLAIARDDAFAVYVALGGEAGS